LLCTRTCATLGCNCHTAPLFFQFLYVNSKSAQHWKFKWWRCRCW